MKPSFRRNGRQENSILTGKRKAASVSLQWKKEAYGVRLVSYSFIGATRTFIPSITGQKSYSKQTVYDAHLTSKKHVKAIAKQAASSEPPPNPNGVHTSPATFPNDASSWRTRLRNAALFTHLSATLLVTLTLTINETKSNVERRFSLTAREREQELLEQSKPPVAPTNNGDGAGEEEEEEERIYNPLKLPLGWDGKPIPYWLYKLHGLGVEYRCEICSDHVYMGRYGDLPALADNYSYLYPQ